MAEQVSIEELERPGAAPDDLRVTVQQPEGEGQDSAPAVSYVWGSVPPAGVSPKDYREACLREAALLAADELARQGASE